MEKVQRIKRALAIGEECLDRARELVNNPYAQSYYAEACDWIDAARGMRVMIWRISDYSYIVDDRLAQAVIYFFRSIDRLDNSVNWLAISEMYKVDHKDTLL